MKMSLKNSSLVNSVLAVTTLMPPKQHALKGVWKIVFHIKSILLLNVFSAKRGMLNFKDLMTFASN